MRLNALFCDGAIFQANKPVRIFGTGGGTLEIEFCGKTYSEEKTGACWCMELAPCDYGGPYEMTVTMDGRITDISQPENAVRQKMMAHAKRSYMLCTSDKLDQTYYHNLCTTADITGVIQAEK